MAVQAEGELPALPGGGGGQPAAPTAPVPRAGVPALQEAHPHRTTQRGAGPGARGTVAHLVTECSEEWN